MVLRVLDQGHMTVEVGESGSQQTSLAQVAHRSGPQAQRQKRLAPRTRLHGPKHNGGDALCSPDRIQPSLGHHRRLEYGGIVARLREPLPKLHETGILEQVPAHPPLERP